MANKKISQLTSRTPTLADLMLIGDASTGFSYKATVSEVATIIQTDIGDAFVTLDTTQTISGAKTFSNALTLTSVADAGVDTDKFLVLNAGNVVKYRTGTELLSDIGGQASLTLTTTGSSGASTLVGATLNIPTYTLSGLGGVPTSRTLTINGTAYDLSADRSWSVGTVTSVGLSTGTTGTDVNVSGSPITSSGSITLNIPTASSTNRGVLSSTDWGTFNSKIGGSGTTNKVAKFTASGTIGDSIITDNGSSVTIAGSFVANNVRAEQYVQIKQTNTGYSSSGYTTIQSNSVTPSFTFNYGDSVRYATFNFASGDYYYTLPSATGTLALTSDIPSLSGYVPYSGATSNVNLGSYTLTTGAVTINGNGNELIMTSSDANGQYINFQTNGGSYGYVGNAYHLMSSPSNVNTDLAIRANTNLIFASGGSTERMRITSGGNVLIGTTTDAGYKLDVNGVGRIYNSFGELFRVEGTSTGNNTNYYTAKNGSGDVMQLGIANAAYSNAGYPAIVARGSYLYAPRELGIITEGYPIMFQTGGTERMRITSGGAIKISDGTLTGGGGFEFTSEAYFGARFQSSGYKFMAANNTTEYMRITSGGNVLVGTTTDNGYKLQVNGGAYIDNVLISPFTYTNTTANSANIYMGSTGTFERSTSSIKYKTDVRDYDKGLAEVLQMRPVYYKGKNDGSKQFAGLIAEEIDSIGLKEFVQYASDGSPDALAYQNMVALLTNAIKELNIKVQDLKAEIEILKKK